MSQTLTINPLASYIEDTASSVADKLAEVDQRLDDHIAQETARDEALDAAERDLRVVCNRNAEARRNAAQAAQEAQAATKEARRRVEARAAARRAAKEAAQARWDANRNTFVLRTFCPLAGPSIMAILTAYGIVPYVPTLIVTIAALLFLIVNFVAYATRNRREREALAKAWAWIVEGKNKIFAKCKAGILGVAHFACFKKNQ